MTRSVREHTIMVEILNALGSRSDVRCWRNPVGAAAFPMGRDRLVWRRFGLVGSPDIVGFLRGGWFLSVEVKRDDAPLTPEQASFFRVGNQFGCCCIVARSVEEAVSQIDAFLATRDPDLTPAS